MSLFRRVLSSNIGQLVIELVLVAVPAALLAALLNLIFGSVLQSLVGDLFLNILEAVVVAVIFVQALRKIEHISPSEVGLPGHQWFRQLLIGFLCGGALMAVVMIVLAITGSYRITNVNPFAVVQLVSLIVAACLLALLLTRNKKVGFLHYVLFALLVFGFLPATVSLLILIGGAVQEEFVFRGIIFRKLEASFGSWVAIAVSAILFGILHLLSPTATLVGAIALVVSAGVLFAAIYILTRSLWWAIGVHLGWNFFEGPVFGVQVSGHVIPGFFSSAITGPEVWTGGSFGPEAGLAAIFIVGAVAFYLCFRAAREQRMIPRNRRYSQPQESLTKSIEQDAHV
jgi:membrane protease YdiL (CAAX protease family)